MLHRTIRVTRRLTVFISLEQSVPETLLPRVYDIGRPNSALTELIVALSQLYAGDLGNIPLRCEDVIASSLLRVKPAGNRKIHAI